MKKALIIFLLVSATLVSCDSDSSVRPVDYMALASEKIYANQKFLDEAFTVLAADITKDTIQKEKNAAPNLAVFARAMSKRALDVFEKTLEAHLTENSGFSGGVHVATGDVNGDGVHDQIDVIGSDQPLEGYKKLLLKDAKAKSAEINKWIVFKTYEDKSTSEEMPIESFSLNYAKVEMLLGLSDILAMAEKTDKQIEEEVKNLGVQANLPEALIALLLPAVQKNKPSHTNEKFLLWLNTTVVDPAIGGGLDRDIIRRIVAAEFLGGMELFIQQNYNMDNQDTASFNIMKARFQTALMFVWREVWEQQ